MLCFNYHLFFCLMLQCHHNAFVQVAHVTVIDAGRHHKRIQFAVAVCVVAYSQVLSGGQKQDDFLRQAETYCV